MSLSPYDYESILIGTVLRFGDDAASLVLPALTPDKFIYSKTGKLGFYDHRDIWRALEKTYLVDRCTVNVANVLTNVADKSEDTGLYLQALTGMITDRYHIYEPDRKTIQNFAEIVDKVGGVYALKAKAMKLADGLGDQSKFEKEALQITDVDQWANNSLSAFRNTLKASTGGLQHISVGAANLRELWARQMRGEQLTFLPYGMPTLVGGGFFPEGCLSVVHGMSGAGKSAFVHQVNLGAAIGLKMNNIPGCIAIFSLEMSQERLIARLASLLSGFNLRDFSRNRERITEEDYHRLLKWLDFVETLPIYIDQTNMITTSALQYSTEGLHVSEVGPVRMCSADYVELFGDDEGDNKEQKLDYVIHQNLNLTRLIGANFIIVSQTTYSSQGIVYPAGPAGVRYSKAILHAADEVYEQWNPIYMKEAGVKYAQIDGVSDYRVTLFRQKGRDDSLGQWSLNWDPTCTQYSDPLLPSGIIFDHLKEVYETLGVTSAQVVDIEDTSFGDF